MSSDVVYYSANSNGGARCVECFSVDVVLTEIKNKLIFFENHFNQNQNSPLTTTLLEGVSKIENLFKAATSLVQQPADKQEIEKYRQQFSGYQMIDRMLRNGV